MTADAFADGTAPDEAEPDGAEPDEADSDEAEQPPSSRKKRSRPSTTWFPWSTKPSLCSDAFTS